MAGPARRRIIGEARRAFLAAELAGAIRAAMRRSAGLRFGFGGRGRAGQGQSEDGKAAP